ncbi:MAM and LDL-receptor class A domain-containing protein 2 [Larimichthys crocea]|uniref:Uncharacterized protein n=1 Tax=Larimichthys crocea TaxID=215358 RepID=A0ACD3QRD3_LARCR|nr:MAM and LDL-receptor class A domain-containing protein 2 [Larimichthys crocea]
MRSNYIILESTFGLRIMIDGQYRLFLKVDERYKYELCGLCGTYSGQQDDDFVTPGGQNATGPFEFGDSWMVPGNDECTSHPNDVRLCDNDEENEAYHTCDTLLSDAFSPCHEHIHPSIYLNSCVYDYCATSGDQHTLCESLKSYAAACQVAGIELNHWQTDTPCAEPPTPTPTTTPTSPTPDQTFCPMNCNFEKNLCGWEQLIQDSFDWTRTSGPTPSYQTGPDQDHTTGDGFYMYIEGNSVTHGDSARLMSSACHYDGPLCLHFWYHMYGSASAMALNIYLLKDNKSTKLSSVMNNYGPEWHPLAVDITVSGPFQIIVEGIRGSNAQSDVAIDDISIHFGSCSGRFPGLNSGTELPPTSTEILPLHPVCNFDCSYDSGLCSWNQMVTDAFDWTWQSGSTPTLMTGPSADHTGDGHYLYIEASSVAHGDTARLISSECLDYGSQCLQFWYHMYGSADTMGINVYLLQNTLANDVWSKRNDQGNVWQLAQVDFTTTGAFQIIIEGRRGSNEESDVAIDDVKLYRGRCSVCNIDCNFDNSLCNWNQMVTDAFDWTWQSGSTPTMMTGPSSDHTTGVGHYLYIEASSVTHGDTARLISLDCSHTGPQCLQFWYHMYGSADTMGINVYLFQDRKALAVWQKRNDQGNKWHLAQVDLTTTGAFQIIFEGRRGSNDQSDVAIDDVLLHHGHCTGTELPPASSSTQPLTSASHPPSTTIFTTITTTTTTPTPCDTQTPTVTPTTRPQPSTTARPQPPTTARPQHSTTARPQPPTTARPQPPTTARPHPPTTARPQPPTTARPHPPTTARPQPPTTARPQPPTTARPQPPSTTIFTTITTTTTTQTPCDTQTPTITPTTRPQPPTTGRPQPPTTARPQPPTTARPQPPTTARPQPPTTARPQPPTTAKPQPTTSIKPHPTTGTPQPTTTAASQSTTARPQPPTTPETTLPCPQNSHYTNCITACSPTCTYLNGPPGCSNSEDCMQGCVCNEGFVQKGGTCVPIQQCGCVDGNGNVYQFNEVWYTNHCQQKCECEKYRGMGRIDCDSKDECDGNAVCLQNEEGNYYCQSTGFNECTIKTEYKTFDKMDYDFKGDHSYVLVQTKNLPSNLPDVYIEAINKEDADSHHSSDSSSEENHSRRARDEDEDEDNNSDDSDEDDDDSEEDEEDHRLQALKIRVYNHTVEFRERRKLVVDGRRARTPVSPTAGLNIYEHFSRIYLKTDFGLSVEFDGHSKAEIILPRIYRRKIGGLCGNFDGQKQNDWMKPDGTRARSAKEFGESWRV